MVETKNDVISFVNEITETEIAEEEFFRQMNIAEESIRNEGTITSAELRATLGF